MCDVCNSDCDTKLTKKRSSVSIKLNNACLVLFGILFGLSSVLSVAADERSFTTTAGVNSKIVGASESESELDDWSILYPSKVRIVPGSWNRFNYPWYTPDRVRFLTLEESRYRVLYSPVRPAASDGLGHNSAVMNAEIGVALRLGLSYSHRVSSHGSLTRKNPNAVEEFFGWGHGQIPREFIRDSFCKSSLNMSHGTCHVCEGLKRNETFSGLQFDNLVELPYNLTYGRMKCVRSGSPSLRGECKKQQDSFLKQNNKSHTIFQMPLVTCATNPADSYFDPKTRAFMFHSYWDRHGVLNHNSSADRTGKSTIIQKYNIPILRLAGRRRPLEYPEHALNIAIHARRGDFFKETRRNMVSTATFGRVVREFLAIVQEHGGIFARMPVIVHLYSEGAPKEKNRFQGHDISHMTHLYMDSDGAVRDAGWVTQTIRAFGSAEVESHRSGNFSEKGGPRKPRRLLLFPGGLKVKFHIAADTLQSMHEMISADVFIGSESGMSTHIVSTMARGLYLLPTRLVSHESECCQVTFSPRSGLLANPEHVKVFWGAFAGANEASATRAYLANKVQSMHH
ncbi:hypothetical protein FGB62_116g024 [Gracilaria domingensis]|nr:hypothetical protein FGB62_116g024 [Gracilaria domingensis]